MSVPSRSRGIGHIRAERSSASREVLLPAQSIIHNEVVSGLTLLLAAVMALVWANSSWNESYRLFQNFPITLKVGEFGLEGTFHHLVNDGLMAVFFFVVGLEIKRELVRGELAHWRHAAFPVAGALGGMVVPATMYMALNFRGTGASGWGIPMATDIAFALSVLALVGDRIPASLRIFLLAFAIVDDIGAIIVIAVFYTAQVSIPALFVAAAVLALILLMLKVGLRNPFLYLATGTLLWVAVFESGVHATIAGVVLGVVAPSRQWFSERMFAKSVSALLERFHEALGRGDVEEKDAMLGKVEEVARGTEAPLDRLERLVHPWVSFVVLPVFALVNAGVTLSAAMLNEAVGSPVTLGIFIGLVIGKTVGIVASAWVAVGLGFAKMPQDIAWRHIAGVGMLGGIGFTVALFMTELAFHDEQLVGHAKVGILSASLLAGIIGYATLRSR